MAYLITLMDGITGKSWLKNTVLASDRQSYAFCRDQVQVEASTQ